MKTLYISDLDGTLLTPDRRLSERTRQILNRLTQKGLLFTYATARSIHSASIVTAGWDPALPVIVYNGCMVLHAQSREVYIENRFEEEDRRYLNRIISKHGISPFVYSRVGGQERVFWKEDKVNEGMRAYIESRPGDRRFQPCQTWEQVYRGDIFYYTCIAEKEKLQPLYHDLQKLGRYQVTYQREIYTEQEWWLEIMPRDATKAQAALRLKEKLGCDRIIAFGDGINDLPLFQISDECYAVENAVQELKQLATGVIGSNRTDGVARWLEAGWH